MPKNVGFSRITMLGVWLALCASLLAQDSRVVGTVTDESGAVIPGARVTATNQATNLERDFETDSTGNYDIPGLQVGAYMVRAEADGFRAAQTEITLEVNQTVRQNFRLPIGSVAETVSVIAQAPLLQADSSTVSQVITNRQIVELPLNGRSFTSLALLVPGVTPRGSGLSMFGESGTFSINGARPGTENYMVEGVTTNSSNTRQPQLSPSIEAIQEFSIQTSSYTAEYGRGSAAVNVITKSGNNQFQGNIYEFIRNDALAANNFFQNQLANPEDADSNVKRNQFGGTVGGPIIRDKTFFFAHFEGNRLRQGATSTYRVPTPLEMQADFSQSPGVQQIVDPTAGNIPFPDKVIPEHQWHSSYRYFRGWWPGPNAPGNLLISAPKTSSDADQFGARVDHNFSDNDRVYFRYFWARRDEGNPGVGTSPGHLANNTIAIDSGQYLGHWTHTFSPTLLVSAQYSRSIFDSSGIVGPNCFAEDGCTNHIVESGIEGADFTSQFYPGAPQLSFGGNWLQMAGTRDPLRVTYPTDSWRADVTSIRGKHTIKAGADFYMQDLETRLALFARGVYVMNGTRTSGRRTPWSDFVMGQVAGGRRAIPTTLTGIDYRNFHFYVQDDWKVTPRLTVNLGMRYEVNLFPTAIAGGASVSPDSGEVIFADLNGDGDPRSEATHAPGFDLLFPLVQDSLVPSGSLGLAPSMIDTDRNNFGPRIGLAWRPAGDKTVVRAGYGLYYLVIANGNIGEQMITQPPFSIRQNGGPGSIDSTFPAFETLTSIAPNTWSPVAFDRNQAWPYEQQMSFTIQHSLANRLIFETGYVGKMGTHLVSRERITLPASRPSFVPANVVLHDAHSTSNYHSWQSRLEKRYSAGLAFSAAYTWSRAFDYSSEDRDTGGGFNKYGPSDFDVPQRFVGSVVWDLPFGSNRKYLSDPDGATGAILGGWQLSIISQYQSGAPFHPFWAGGNTNNARVPVAALPDRIGSGAVSNPTPEMWFDSSAFIAHQKPANPNASNLYLPSEGDVGRNILRSDGMANWDIGIMKNFHFGERYRVQFRAELFNAFNHVQFSVPGVNRASFGRSAANRSPRIRGNPTVDGRVLATNSIPRQVQFALKFFF